MKLVVYELLVLSECYVIFWSSCLYQIHGLFMIFKYFVFAFNKRQFVLYLVLFAILIGWSFMFLDKLLIII